MGSLVGKISLPQNAQIQMASQKKENVDDRFIPNDYKTVAKGMEQQFADYMLTQMNNTIGEDEEEKNNSSMSLYKNLETTEKAKMLSENNGGLGVQKMILDQIYPRRLRTQANLENYERLQGKNLLHRREIKTHNEKTADIKMAQTSKPQMAPDLSQGETK